MNKFTINAFHEKLLFDFACVRLARGFNRGKGDAAPVLCREYLHFLEQRNCQEVTSSTVFLYRQFCAHIKSRNKFRGKGTLSHVQQQHIRYAIHSMYEFLQESGVMSSVPVSGSLFHVPQLKEKDVLNIKNISAMFEATLTTTESAILALAYGCGLRRAELERLKISDYNPNAHTVTVREGKNHKSRVVPVSNRMNQYLSVYLMEVRLKTSSQTNNLLIHSNGANITGEELYRIVRRIAKRAGIEDKTVGLHILRNSIAVHMLNKGADIDFVQRFLGHSLVDTTMLYATRRRKRISLRRRINSTLKLA